MYNYHQKNYPDRPNIDIDTDNYIDPTHNTQTEPATYIHCIAPRTTERGLGKLNPFEGEWRDSKEDRKRKNYVIICGGT